jgi:hypothetical protein
VLCPGCRQVYELDLRGVVRRTARRRIDPHKLREELAAVRDNRSAESKEVKPAREHLHEEDCAVAAVVQALRHAGVTARPKTACARPARRTWSMNW